ncbi:MAG: PAS domain S-box protein, partial [Cyclobacteriaceae bacterium]
DDVVGGIVVNTVELTDLIETQEKLKTSEARYRGFYESQTNFVIRTDLEGNYSYVNKKFIAEFGWIYPDGKIMGKSCMPSICEYDHQRVIEVVEKCMTNPEKVYKIEIDKPKKGGGTVTTLWDFICMVDGNRRPIEIQCMGIDISERVAFERALKKSNERYEFVNRATNDAIYEWDVVNDQIEWGEGFYRMFGYREGEGISKLADWANLKHPMELKSGQKKWEDFMADKNEFRWYEEARLRKADGVYLETEEIGFLIRDDSGHPLRMIGVLRDISEIKKAETQKLIQQELAGIFKKDKGLKQSLSEVLEYLTAFGEYKAAEIWLIGNDKINLNLVCRYVIDKSLNSFYFGEGAITKVKKGEGLPGKVWDALKAAVWDGIDGDELFLRWQEAQTAGLKSGLALPVLHTDEPLGVIVFLSDQGISESMKDFYLPLGAYLGPEIKRKQQEEEMFLMFQSAPKMLAIASPKGHFTRVNSAFCEIMGYKEEEIIFRPFEVFLHPEDIAGTNKEYAESILEKRRIKNYIIRCRTKSGEYRWISWNSSKPFGDEGFVFAYGNDITEMKELQSLHDNATQLARVGSWEIDVLSEEVYLSKISREICKIGEHEALDLASVIAFYRDDVREFVAHTINKGIESGANWDFELPLIDAFGNEVWVRNIGEAEFREEKCVRLYGSLQDIHTRKVLEQDLARKNELLSAISKVICLIASVSDVSFD